jgi:hypothetical protein
VNQKRPIPRWSTFSPSIPAAKIPLYLLVDRQQGQVTLFSDPVRSDYTTQTRVPFGGSIKLPPPFSFTLETEELAT